MTLTFALDSMQETGATVSVSAEAGLDWSSKTAFSSSLQVDMTKEINSIDKAVAAGLSNNQVMVLLVWTHRIVLYSYIVGCLCSVHTMETHVNVSTWRPLLGLVDDSYVSYIFRFRGYRLADGVVDGSRPVDRSCRSAPRADIGHPGGPRRASPSSTSPDSSMRRPVACRSARDAFSYTLQPMKIIF